MAKPVFNKKDFQEAVDATDNYDAVASGVYVATLEKTSVKITDKGARQVAFGYQIDDSDENHPNQYVWTNQTTVDTEGNSSPVGLKIYNKLLHTLSDGQFSPDDFEWDSKGDIANEEAVLAKLEGTEVRLRAKLKVKGEYTNHDITIQQVLKSVYGQSTKLPPTEENNTEEELDEVLTDETVAAQPSNVDNDVTVDIVEGGRLGYYADDGITELFGTVTSLVDDGSGSGLFMIKPEKGGAKANIVTRKPEDVFVLAPPTEIEDEVISVPTLTVGGKAEYEYGGVTLTSKVYKIDEDTGKVIVIIEKDGKRMGRTLDIKKVKAV